jgi:formylmethanofuran dehydrogenase subunit E
LYAGELLNLELPRTDKRLLVIVESDGCFLDGVAEATGCRAGRRTMRIMDHGKAAVTFVDTLDGRTVRIWPHPEARQRALLYAPEHRDRWQAQLDGYCRMPASELLLAEAVTLSTPLAAILGRPGIRITCVRCGEEVMNDREVRVAELPMCLDCAGDGYFSPASLPFQAADVRARQHIAG